MKLRIGDSCVNRARLHFRAHRLHAIVTAAQRARHPRGRDWAAACVAATPSTRWLSTRNDASGDPVGIGALLGARADTGRAAAQGAADPPRPAPAGARPRSSAAPCSEQLGTDEAARASQERIEAIDDETLKLLSEYRRALAGRRELRDLRRPARVAGRVAERGDGLDRPAARRDRDDLARGAAADAEDARHARAVRRRSTCPFLLEERSKRVATLEGDDDARGRHASPRSTAASSRPTRSRWTTGARSRPTRASSATATTPAPCSSCASAASRCSTRRSTARRPATGTRDTKSWVVDDDYAHAFKEGVAVAKKLRAPEMLIVPVPAPKEAKS